MNSGPRWVTGLAPRGKDHPRYKHGRWMTNKPPGRFCLHPSNCDRTDAHLRGTHCRSCEQRRRAAMDKPPTGKQLSLLRFAADHPRFRLSDAAAHLSCATANISAMITRLHAKGLMQKVGGWGGWALTAAGLQAARQDAG